MNLTRACYAIDAAATTLMYMERTVTHESAVGADVDRLPSDVLHTAEEAKDLGLRAISQLPAVSEANWLGALQAKSS